MHMWFISQLFMTVLCMKVEDMQIVNLFIEYSHGVWFRTHNHFYFQLIT